MDYDDTKFNSSTEAEQDEQRMIEEGLFDPTENEKFIGITASGQKLYGAKHLTNEEAQKMLRIL